MQRVLKRAGDVKLDGKLIDQLVKCSSACCNVTMTSKVIIPVLVDERFFSINVQKSRIEQNFLPRFTIRATQERRYKPLTFQIPRNNVNFQVTPLYTLTQRNCVRKKCCFFPAKSGNCGSLRFKY